MSELDFVRLQLAEVHTQLKLALNRERIWRELMDELLSAKRRHGKKRKAAPS